MTHTNGERPAGRSWRKAAAVALAASAAVLAAGRPAHALWFDPIVFDPEALVQRVVQIAQVVLQIRTAGEQVRNQLRELARLGGDVAPDVSSVVGQVRSELDNGLYAPPDAGPQLNARFPTDFTGTSPAQYQSIRADWDRQYRQSLVENRRLENRVYQQMDDTSGQVRRIVEASNDAAGETAAVQAHNDLLAVTSGELSKLQALRAARARAKVEKLARGQSELAYGEAERARVRQGGDGPQPPTTAVVDPFQNAQD